MPAAGETVAHYRVLRKIGAGGMGVVYEAEDLQLDRHVALKFLPAERAADPVAMERFRREARSASSLNHPNICTIHHIGEADGLPFIAMELMNGRTLRQEIGGKPVPVEQVMRWGLELTDALQAAHARGVIHRDIKPANVFVTERGSAKLLDFGLAHQSTLAAEVHSEAPTESANLTHTGAVVGTVAYMSPEQVRGKRLDPRSDLFSIGAVLYEMATGTQPFGGSTRGEVLESLFTTTPVPASQRNPAVPAALDAIIAKALEKDPALRYQSAAEIHADLLRLRRDSDEVRITRDTVVPAPRSRPRWRGVAVGTAALVLVGGAAWQATRWGTPSAPAQPERVSLAVLPFVNMSSESAQEYFSDGLTEELQNLLTRHPRLRVIGRSSSFRFKGKKDDPRDIGRALGVTHLVEGSVHRDGKRIRIRAQIVQVKDGTSVWSESYDRTMDDIFRVQDDIAGSVAQALRVTLLGPTRLARAPNPEAYNAYLQGRHLQLRNTQEAYAQAEAHFKEAVKLDPEFASAWASLANIHTKRADGGSITMDTGYELARQEATRAIALDPQLAYAHSQMVWIHMFRDWDWAAAEVASAKALALERSLSTLVTAGTLAGIMGRLEDEVSLHEQALSIDPLSASAHINLALSLYKAGRLPEAEALLGKLLVMNPKYGGAQRAMGKVLLAQGRAPEALLAIEKEASAVWRAASLPLVYHAVGRKAEAEAALSRFIEQYGDDAGVQIAEVYAQRGEADQAFAWLERAHARRDGALMEMKVNPLLTPLSRDPRWQAFLEKMNLPGLP
jgi:serine/threonine protein kinase/Tfp pilus assembly protein PilF